MGKVKGKQQKSNNHKKASTQQASHGGKSNKGGGAQRSSSSGAPRGAAPQGLPTDASALPQQAPSATPAVADQASGSIDPAMIQQIVAQVVQALAPALQGAVGQDGMDNSGSSPVDLSGGGGGQQLTADQIMQMVAAKLAESGVSADGSVEGVPSSAGPDLQSV